MIERPGAPNPCIERLSKPNCAIAPPDLLECPNCTTVAIARKPPISLKISRTKVARTPSRDTNVRKQTAQAFWDVRTERSLPQSPLRAKKSLEIPRQQAFLFQPSPVVRTRSLASAAIAEHSDDRVAEAELLGDRNGLHVGGDRPLPMLEAIAQKPLLGGVGVGSATVQFAPPFRQNRRTLFYLGEPSPESPCRDRSSTFSFVSIPERVLG